jgi:hypothetical protein
MKKIIEVFPDKIDVRCGLPYAKSKASFIVRKPDMIYENVYFDHIPSFVSNVIKENIEADGVRVLMVTFDMACIHWNVMFKDYLVATDGFNKAKINVVFQTQEKPE